MGFSCNRRVADCRATQNQNLNRARPLPRSRSLAASVANAQNNVQAGRITSRIRLAEDGWVKEKPNEKTPRSDYLAFAIQRQSAW
jgi:hypothetical protein